MRVFSTIVILIVLAWPAIAQQKLADLKAKEKEIAAELQKTEFRAKLDVPAVDCIFVQDGKMVPGTYTLYIKENPIALKAHAITKVSSIKLLEHGVQVFVANDAAAMIAVTPSNLETAQTPVKDLVGLVRTSLAALFVPVAKEEKK